jgi:hypothetical protein
VKAELKAVRASLWQLLEDLRTGDLETERAAVAVAALDSLIDVQRLESQEAVQEPPHEKPPHEKPPQEEEKRPAGDREEEASCQGN